VVPCASPEYVRQHGAPSKPEDLSGHACLNFAYEHFRHRWPIEGPEGKVEVPIRSAMVSNNAELLRQSAVDGMGIVMRPTYSLGDDLTTGRLVHLMPGYRIEQVTVYMVYPSRRFLSGKVRSFIDFIGERFPHPESDPWLAKHQVGAKFPSLKDMSTGIVCS
jgi:DNA-binding transcriptional LysR family regulator